MGPLYCLSSGDGEVAWVRRDDLKMHFGVSIQMIGKSSPTKTLSNGIISVRWSTCRI